MSALDVDVLLREADVVVCCGSGGVGKTTVAAALGLEAARLGRRVVVVTIDPARRERYFPRICGMAQKAQVWSHPSAILT